MKKNNEGIIKIVKIFGISYDLKVMYKYIKKPNLNIKDKEIQICLPSKYKKIDNNTFLLDGEMPIYEVEKILGIDLPEGDYDTISGYLLFELNRIPSDNEKGIMIETDKVNYKIEKIKGNRILKIKACKNLED